MTSNGPADDTIFALSSGAAPAAIAIVRVSGAAAAATAQAIAGNLPQPRHAALRTFRGVDDHDVIDRGLLLWFPAQASVTGEDLTEYHIHGGRAVVARLLAELSARAGLRHAEPGEFTRRSLLNGRMSLIEAEALSDLLFAEGEAQRRAAFAVFDGALGEMIEAWRVELLGLAAEVEAMIDMDGEEDVLRLVHADSLSERLIAFAGQLHDAASGPQVEALRDGATVVLAGPPNSGKSSLLNRLSRRDAALVSPVAGTTRDVVEVPLLLGGKRLRMLDTAGLRQSDDLVERLGVERAAAAAAAADLLLWLGDDTPPGAVESLWLNPRCDLPGRSFASGRLSVSTVTGEGLAKLKAEIDSRLASTLVPDGLALNERQRHCCTDMAEYLVMASEEGDLLIVAENLRHARERLDQLAGRSTTEDVLKTLFASFCVGK